MKIGLIPMVALVILAIAGMALATAYLWDGSGANALFSNQDNWAVSSGFCQPPNCWPNTTNDDAVIDIEDTVQLVNEEIDDLTVADDVTFTANPLVGGAVLDVDTATFQGDGEVIIVTFTGGAKIRRQ